MLFVIPTERSVSAVVRAELENSRLWGRDFDDAWPHAVRSATSGQKDSAAWREALYSTEPVWRAAYERQPADCLDAAISTLSVAHVTST